MIVIHSKINVWSYYFIGLLTFLLIIALRHSISVMQTKALIIKTVYFSIGLISIDTLLRFKYPRSAYLDHIYDQGQLDYVFYGYKHSFLFQDSNFVGLFAISIYFLFRAHRMLFQYKKTTMLVTILMIALTFSRAAIISLIIVEILILIDKVKIKSSLKVVIFLFLLAPGIILINDIINNINDESFKSKFLLLHNFLTTLSEGDIINLLFGWGFDNTRDYWGIAAHNLYNTLILETGVIGFLLICFCIIYCFLINTSTKYHLLAIGITSLSFGLIFTPIFVPLALNIISQNTKHEKF
ncbi:hypothetical protein M1D83_06605 [Enterobacteriaceae bacterium]